MIPLLNHIAGWYLRRRYAHIEHFMAHPHEVQQRWLQYFMLQGRRTVWGETFGMNEVNNATDFSKRLPITDYDAIKEHINRMMYGEPDVLWPGVVEWFAKSSGTTSDKSKFIPVTPENLEYCHIKGAWDAASLVYTQRPETQAFAGKMLHMGGSHQPFAEYPSTNFGDVSAIILAHLPALGRYTYTPSLADALLPNTDDKLRRIANVAVHEDVRAISGAPTWLNVLFRRLLDQTGAENIHEIWPNLELITHGGMSFTPYREQFKRFLPSPDFQYWEVYNASEGYFAVRHQPDDTDDMLLLLDNGIYYEFLPAAEFDSATPRAITLQEVELGQRYALVVTTNAGLWRYIPGDTVEFTCLAPYKIKIVGRMREFINAFGEELMVSDADKAVTEVCRITQSLVHHYTVAPIYFSGDKSGGHEWAIEFERQPADLEKFADLLDDTLKQINSDYEAKRFKNMAMDRLKIHALPTGTFNTWLKRRGKYGLQNKVPRLANNRKIMDDILLLAKELGMGRERENNNLGI